MSHYTHLSIEEREKSRVMLEQGIRGCCIMMKIIATVSIFIKNLPSKIYHSFKQKINEYDKLFEMEID